MTPLWLLLGGVILGIGLLAMPVQVEVRWRKPWGGSLRWCWRIAWLGIPIRRGRHSGRRAWGSQDWRRLWGLAQVGIRCGHLHRWQLYTEIGFRDPAVTGRWIGVISALPPVMGRCFHLTFTRCGWQTQGRVQGSLALGWLVGFGLRQWFQKRGWPGWGRP